MRQNLKVKILSLKLIYIRQTKIFLKMVFTKITQKQLGQNWCISLEELKTHICWLTV